MRGFVYYVFFRFFINCTGAVFFLLVIHTLLRVDVFFERRMRAGVVFFFLSALSGTSCPFAAANIR